MKKKVLSIFLLASVIGTSAIAYDMKKGECNMKKDCKHGEMKKRNHGFSFMRYIHYLDLDKKQMNEIRDIMHNTKPKFESYSKAFTNDGFDKKIYIDVAMNKYKNMIEFKGTLIEKIYAVLTKEQKVQLKKLMEDNLEKPKKGMKNDKHCNGRG